MLSLMAGYLIFVGIVAVECVIILAVAIPFSRIWNQNNRCRLFGHFDTSPPRGIRFVSQG
jgi:hypothetical protein